MVQMKLSVSLREAKHKTVFLRPRGTILSIHM
jgi:hypothetical protein